MAEISALSLLVFPIPPTPSIPHQTPLLVFFLLSSSVYLHLPLSLISCFSQPTIPDLSYISVFPENSSAVPVTSLD